MLGQLVFAATGLVEFLKELVDVVVETEMASGKDAGEPFQHALELFSRVASSMSPQSGTILSSAICLVCSKVIMAVAIYHPAAGAQTPSTG